jgi:hypothetical protein
MSPLAIVAIAISATLFALLLLAAAGLIIYGQIQLRREISTTTLTVSNHQSALQLLGKDIGSTLESHRSKMDEIVRKINGEEIAQAAKVIVTSATRIERACIAFGQLSAALVSQEELGESALERAANSGLGPESYAPNPTGERYTGISRTAQGDAEAADELELDNLNEP